MNNEAILNLAKKIKKEHFIKLALWLSGTILTLFWLAFLIATSISAGERIIVGKEFKVLGQNTINTYFNNKSYVINKLELLPNGELQGTFLTIMDKVDWNPLCLTYTPDLVGWYMLVLLAPIGYLGIIFIIGYMKNMITPQEVKKKARQALQFGYLKQNDVDYIVDEIDYNIGIKQRPNKADNEQKQENKEQE